MSHYSKPPTAIYMCGLDAISIRVYNQGKSAKYFDACFSMYLIDSGYILYNCNMLWTRCNIMKGSIVISHLPIGTRILQCTKGCHPWKCRLRDMLRTRCNIAIWFNIISHPPENRPSVIGKLWLFIAITQRTQCSYRCECNKFEVRP